MKITINRVPEATLEEFADQYGLELTVQERPGPYVKNKFDRFYACFRGVERKEGGMLESVCGNGETPEKAIEAYARMISEQLLVIDAMLTTRVEVVAPRLIYKVVEAQP